MFFVHQIGGFLSAWLGGVCFEQSGGCLWISLADAVLCTLAAIISFLILTNRDVETKFESHISP